MNERDNPSMKYYLAPMEGLTGYIYRNAYHACYHAMDKYFTPLDVYKRQKLVRGERLVRREKLVRGEVLAEGEILTQRKKRMRKVLMGNLL